VDAGGGEEGEWTRDVDVSTRALFAVVALDEGTRWMGGGFRRAGRGTAARRPSPGCVCGGTLRHDRDLDDHGVAGAFARGNAALGVPRADAVLARRPNA